MENFELPKKGANWRIIQALSGQLRGHQDRFSQVENKKIRRIEILRIHAKYNLARAQELVFFTAMRKFIACKIPSCKFLQSDEIPRGLILKILIHCVISPWKGLYAVVGL